MAQNGLNGGLIRGLQQGVKGGLGLANMRPGLVSGIKEGIPNKNLFQNPLNLRGNKTPLFFYNADGIPIDPDGTNSSTSLTNLITGFNPLYESTAKTLTFNSATTTIPQDEVFYNRATVNHSVGSKFITLGTAWNLATQASITFVAKAVSTGTGVMLQKGTSGASTFRISFEGGNRVQVSFTDSSINTINYTTRTGSIIQSKYYLITVLLDYSKPRGNGSEVRIYINGKEDTNYLSGTFVGSTSANFVVESSYIGAISSGTLAGSYIAAALATEYCYSDIERIRIENYFRWYYGFNF